jgi:hypothetical protein
VTQLSWSFLAGLGGEAGNFMIHCFRKKNDLKIFSVQTVLTGNRN